MAGKLYLLASLQFKKTFWGETLMAKSSGVCVICAAAVSAASSAGVPCATAVFSGAGATCAVAVSMVRGVAAICSAAVFVVVVLPPYAFICVVAVSKVSTL